jgi:hypothetical protein
MFILAHKAISLGGLDQAVQKGTGFGPAGMTGEQPVLAAHDEGMNCISHQVVIRPQAAVLKIGDQPRPLVQRIADRLAQ